jgi:mRNA interferase MazF
MKRGEIWTMSGGGAYTGKPRPAVILQDDRFEATRSVTVCAFTTDPIEAPLLRIPIVPSDENGLDEPSRLMVDKITTLPRSRVGSRLGRLGHDDVVRLNRAILVFLGLAGTTGQRRRVRRS